MPANNPPEQLAIRFEIDDRFASSLRDGRFVVVVEQNSPSLEQPFDSAAALCVAIAKRVRTSEEVVAICVTDRLSTEHCHDPVDTAIALLEAAGKPIILGISGKGSSPERVREILARSRSCGIRDFIAVTGDRSDDHPLPDGGGRVGFYEKGYLDALDALRLAVDADENAHLGAVVNPFKYTVSDQFLQYYKMARKISTGADFIVSQAGWDMKKLQELQWFLQMREIGNAVLARVQLLSTDEVAEIPECLPPGVYMPVPLAGAFQRAARESAAKCHRMQIHRLAMQMVGCRLLGFSGVQVAGIRDVASLDDLLSAFRECRSQYDDYAHWVEGWNELDGGMSFSPSPTAFYTFQNLLDPSVPVYDPELSVMTKASLPLPTGMDRVKARVLSWLLSEETPAHIVKAAQVLLRRNDVKDP
ncbi:MAG: methylenetetrahydrofolate reductase, partial [Lentisphaeria bacterium]|nr:methylenetetrahydrofolate reductase [Lentisphaeria bacterium]